MDKPKGTLLGELEIKSGDDPLEDEFLAKFLAMNSPRPASPGGKIPGL